MGQISNTHNTIRGDPRLFCTENNWPRRWEGDFLRFGAALDAPRNVSQTKSFPKYIRKKLESDGVLVPA